MRGSQIAMILVAVVAVLGLLFILSRSSVNNSLNTSIVTPTTRIGVVSPTSSLPTSAIPLSVTPAGVASVEVDLDEQNDSGQSGTATLTEVNGKAVVEISIDANDDGVAQPAHIHTGKCPAPGGVKYPLTNVVSGKSITTLSVSLADLEKQLPLAINVHESAAASEVYVACGDLTF